VRVALQGEGQEKHEQNASLIHELFSGHALVRHHSETGEPIDSMYEASKRTGMTEHVAPYVRLYTMQIVRFVCFRSWGMHQLKHSWRTFLTFLSSSPSSTTKIDILSGARRGQSTDLESAHGGGSLSPFTIDRWLVARSSLQSRRPPGLER
jgi:hypothetical protein